MDSRDIEFRTDIKFLLKKNMNGKQIINELQNVYHNESPSKSFIYKWIAEFQRGRASVLTENHGGRPTEIGDDKEEAIAAIIRVERRITIRELAEHVSISYGSCQQILKSLGIRLSWLQDSCPGS